MEQVREAQRVCKKCLIKDMPQIDYFRNLYDYIDNLDTDVKAVDALYQERLKRCKACNNLQNGMCRICGCFVELRAAIKNNYCPAATKNW